MDNTFTRLKKKHARLLREVAKRPYLKPVKKDSYSEAELDAALDYVKRLYVPAKAEPEAQPSLAGYTVEEITDAQS